MRKEKTSQNVNKQTRLVPQFLLEFRRLPAGPADFGTVFEQLLVDPAPREGVIAAVDVIGSAELVPPAAEGIELLALLIRVGCVIEKGVPLPTFTGYEQDF